MSMSTALASPRAARTLLALAACILSPAVHDAHAQQIPATAPGRQFSAWLDAANAADRAAMQAFIDAGRITFATVDQALATARRTGGFDVKKVRSSTDSGIVVLVQERGPTKQFIDVDLAVAAREPARVTRLGLRVVEPPPELAPPKLGPRELEAARAGAPYRTFAAYLEALSSADREHLRRFIEASYPGASLDAEAGFAQQTGGFELRELERATATVASGLVQERHSDQFARFTIVVDSAPPHRIERLVMRAIPRPAAYPVARLSDAELAPALRARLEKDAAAGRFAGAVMVAKLGGASPRTLFSGAYGLADREGGVPNALDTRFRIGSMNKMFTATAILQLAQTGKLRLNEPFGTYVADYPNKDVSGKVTIHHLLTHTGGTGDIFGPEFDARRTGLRTHDDYVALYGKRGLRFEPGARWEYSNYGMLLLGVVIERVSGMSYYDYVERHIYRPAGMTRSGSLPEGEAVAGRSVGYTRRGGPWTPNTGTLPWRGTAAGGGYSTVGDLVAFAQALTTHELLDAEHTSLLIAGKVDIADGVKYAYGFDDDRSDGERSVGHGGGAPGMNGELRIYPRSGYVIAALSNLDPPAASQVVSFIKPRLARPVVP